VHLDLFAYVPNGVHVFDHRRLIRKRCSQAKQKIEDRKQQAHL
jgi:hypothetical protein